MTILPEPFWALLIVGFLRESCRRFRRSLTVYDFNARIARVLSSDVRQKARELERRCLIGEDTAIMGGCALSPKERARQGFICNILIRYVQRKFSIITREARATLWTERAAGI